MSRITDSAILASETNKTSIATTPYLGVVDHMQSEEKIVFEPNKPWYILGVTIFFVFIAGMFFTSNYFDMAMGIGGSVLIFFGILSLWMADRGYMNLEFGETYLRINGYFSIRNLILKNEDIKGYELRDTVNQIESLHKQIGLRTRTGQLITFPKAAYANYSQLHEIIDNKYELLEYKPLKNAEFYNKWLPIIGAISGILALIVGLMKIMK